MTGRDDLSIPSADGFIPTFAATPIRFHVDDGWQYQDASGRWHVLDDLADKHACQQCGGRSKVRTRTGKRLCIRCFQTGINTLSLRSWLRYIGRNPKGG